jgi:uncharacterized membrane protein required for colicin V production
MVVDLVALAILALFVLMGALRGGVAGLLGLLTLVLSYAVAVKSAQGLGESISQNLGVSLLVGSAIAGIGGFLATTSCLGLLATRIRTWAAGLRGDSHIGIANRWLGGLCGVVRGGLVVLVVAWLVIWLDAARENLGFGEDLPDLQSSLVVNLTETVVESVVGAAMGGNDVVADVVARVASSPRTAVRGLQGLLADPRIQALQRDRSFWVLVEERSYSSALQRGSFQDIARSHALRRKFVAVGVVPPDSSNDRSAFEKHFARVLSEDGAKLEGILGDPEISAMLRSGDALGLVRHEGVQRRLAKVSGS